MKVKLMLCRFLPQMVNISIADITVLNDNFNFYPSYQCGNVIRSEVLQQHPELNEIFKQLEQILTDKEMAEMNYEIETMGAEQGILP